MGEVVTRRLPWRELLLAAALAAGASPAAQATRAEDMPPPTAEAVRRAASAPAVAAPGAADAGRQRLREGVIGAIDRDAGRVQIEGLWFRLVPGQTRLYRLGRATDASALGPGLRIRFSLPTGAADGAALGVVYVP